MRVTPEHIVESYSRIPFLQPPPHVLLIEGGDIGAERLYDAAHRFNAGAAAAPSQENYHIFGMHRMGTDTIVVAGDAKPDTPVHEGVHFNGVASEERTRMITRILMKRASLNLGFRRRPVKYREVPMTLEQGTAVLAHLGIQNPSGGDPKLVHLVYVPQ